jgi:hypothetical protein
MNTLMNAFFSDMGKAGKINDPNARPLATPPAIAGNTVSQGIPGGIWVKTAYYAVYILACMVVLLYWQVRSSSTSAHHG